jgi:DNA-binding protein H-NS
VNSMELNSLTLAEPKALQKAIVLAIKNAPDKAKMAARNELEAKAWELGYSIKDLLGAGVKTRKKRSAVARYRNPNNPAITWTGAGRRPKWFLEALASGKSPKDLSI